MKFSIITPTYKRNDLLIRTILSVLNQSYKEWEMIIINDSPDDFSYQTLGSTITDPRIHYYVNDINRGVNYSRNRALDNVAGDSDWVIFLDDDDYFAFDALEAISHLIEQNPNIGWFVTNRAYRNGALITKYPTPETWYSYIRDVLILKRCKGDVTHCIKTNLLKTVRYSSYIKQAEEWIFYYQVALHEKMFYHNHNSTLTDGYDKIAGLNFRKRSFFDQIFSIKMFILEGTRQHIILRPSFIFYLIMRLIRIFFK